LMLPYYEMSQELGLRHFDEVRWNVPVLLSFFYPSESAYFWQVLSENCRPDIPFWWIHYTFPGMIPLIGMLIVPFAWIYWKIRKIKISKLVWAVSIVIFLVFVCFIRTYDGQTFFALIFKLPGINSMRVLNRFMNVELFLIVVLLVSLASKLSRKWSILFFLLVVLDNSFVPDRVIRLPKDEITERREAMIELIQKNVEPKHKAFVVLDSEHEFFISQLDAMLASPYVKLPTVNGYSSGCPKGYIPFFHNLDDDALKSWYSASGADSSRILIIRR
ncbi:MAG: hypothetical protein ACI837_001636, partial [Crocinitomicaceae bacterium]